MTTQLYLQKAEMQLSRGLEEKALESLLAALACQDRDTADVAVTGDPSVTYKWYVDGVQTDANGSEFTVPNDTVGNHSVYGVVCVGDDYYTAARYVSETVSYGAYMEADVSLDGKVNAEDLSAMRIKLITGEALSDIEKLSADLNGDGEVDILDLIKIKKLMSENVG